MKKFICLVLAFMLLVSVSFAESEFDISVFRQQKSIIKPEASMWVVSIDDMEARGFISINITGENEATISRSETVVISPDVILINYGESNFRPLPRIWLYYCANTWLFADEAIIKVGDKTYTFNDIDVDREVISSRVQEELVCICTDTSFMDAWIENTKDVKIRLKGEHDYRDFYFPEAQRKNISIMFENFRDAGGYSYLQ